MPGAHAAVWAVDKAAYANVRRVDRSMATVRGYLIFLGLVDDDSDRML
jgi:hypothetical protein